MRFNLCVKCVAKSFIVSRNDSPFRKTFCFACFAQNMDVKLTKHFAKWTPFLHVSLFCDIEISRFIKNSCLVREVNRSFSILLLFRKRFLISQNVS